MAQDPFGQKVNIPRFEPPKLPPGAIRWLIILVAAGAILSTAVFQVGTEEVGVVLRFGVHVENSPPGLHMKLPLGIEQVIKIPVQRQLKADFGYESPQKGVPLRFSRTQLAEQSNMLTGDLNAVTVEWQVQYRIIDPVAFLFKVRNTEETFRDMSEAVVREVVGDRTINEVITVGRGEVRIAAKQALQELANLYETGIQVDDILLQAVTPPNPVKPAFNQVNEAEQEKGKLETQAQSEYNKVVPRARGEAEQTILAAEGYALKRVNEAEGDAARFVALYEEYRKAPEVTRKRIYLETVREILPKVGRKIVVDEQVRGVLPLLNLGGGSGSRPTQEGGN